MARKPSGSVVKHRGKWTARLRWSESTCSNCPHLVGLHAPETPRPCTLCGDCSGFKGIRREWRQTADPNTKAIAGEKLREMLRTLAEGPAKRNPTAGMLFADIARLYMAAYVVEPIYENGVKIRGMKDHRGVRSTIENVLVPAIGDRVASEITRLDLEQLRNERLAAPRLRGGWAKVDGKMVAKPVEVEGKRGIARVNREMAVARQVLNHGVELGALAKNPMNAGRRNALVVMAAERARERVLTPAEEKRLMVAWPERSRDYFVVAMDTGMRRAELLGLAVEDIDRKAKTIRLPWEITKSKKPRTIPTSQRVEAIMKARVNARDAGAKVFDDLTASVIREDFRTARSAAKVKDFRMHDCRATLATRLLQAGVSEAEIAMMTGHRVQRQQGSVDSSRILRKHYLRLTTETLEKATSAIDGDVN